MSYKILYNHLSGLTLYVDEIGGKFQGGFRSNKSITVQIVRIRQIWEKNWSTMGQ